MKGILIIVITFDPCIFSEIHLEFVIYIILWPLLMTGISERRSLFSPDRHTDTQTERHTDPTTVTLARACAEG